MTLMIKCMQHRELIYPEKNDSPILKSKSDKNETVLALDKCRPTLVAPTYCTFSSQIRIVNMRF